MSDATNPYDIGQDRNAESYWASEAGRLAADNAWLRVKVNELEAKLAKVLEGYEVAVSDILVWASYASDYFSKKHDLAGVVERHQTIIKEARDE